MMAKDKRVPWPASMFAPIGDGVTRIIGRGDDGQLRLGLTAGGRAIELRIYRRSLGERDSFEAYHGTAAGIMVPLDLVPILISHLEEIHASAVTR